MKIRILSTSFILFLSGCVIPVHTVKRSDQGIYKEYTVIELFRSDAEAKADKLYEEDVAVYKAKQKAKEDEKKDREKRRAMVERFQKRTLRLPQNQI